METMTNNDVIVTARDFKNFATLANFASTDYSRPILTALCVEIKGGEMITTATDSYRLARLTQTLDTATEGKFLIPGSFLIECAKACKVRSFVSMSFGDVFTVTIDGVTRTTAYQLGDYPNVDQIIPAGDGCQISTIALNPKFLASFEKLHIVKDAGDTAGLVFKFYSELRPVRITVGSVPNFFALLMPIRIKD